MNVYVSDKEQVEMLRQWWKENGKSLIGTVVGVLLIVSGWRYWQHYQATQSANASVIYETLLDHASKAQSNEMKYDVTQLLTHYSHTPYATLGAFISAQNAVNANELTEAREKLVWVIEHAHNKDFKQIAQIRLGRVLLTMRQYDEAFKMLSQVTSPSYASLVNEVRGDVSAAKGDEKAARSAYKSALETLPKGASNKALLQMKYEQLAG